MALTNHWNFVNLNKCCWLFTYLFRTYERCIFTGYEGDNKFIVPRDSDYFKHEFKNHLKDFLKSYKLFPKSYKRIYNSYERIS